MKKNLLFIALFFLTIASWAQVKGGLKAGVNAAAQKWEIDISGYGSGSEKYKGTSFHIGGYLVYKMSEVVSFQPELLYNSLKVDVEDEDMTLNYVSFPMMFGYAVENNKLVFQAGPQVGFMLSSDPGEIKDDGYYKGVDFSFALGATVNLGKFNLGVRYAIGLVDITTTKLEDETETELEIILGSPIDLDMSIKNNNLQFFIGYQLFGE